MPLGRLGGCALGLICVTAAALTLAACGGSSHHSGVTAKAYATSFCGAVGPFEEQILLRSNELRLAADKDVTQNKQALRSFLTALSTATGSAVARLEGAGIPDVPNGRETAMAFLNAFRNIEAAFATAADRSRTLPTTSTGAYKTAADALVSDVKGSLSSLAANLGSLKAPAIEAAARKIPACQSLGSAH
jgi:hypothetical protein